MPLVKQIVRLGNSQGVILDKGVLQMANLEVGAEVEIAVDKDRIVLTPHRYASDDKVRAAADRAVATHGKALKRLAK